MYTAKKGTMYPVKRFVLELEQEKSVEAFLKLDAKIWTTFLKQQKGFVSKQIWRQDIAPRVLAVNGRMGTDNGAGMGKNCRSIF